jgi:hypothetical protein
VAVTFQVIAGGGRIDSTAGQADSTGVVTLPRWRLGKTADRQAVQVTANSLPLPPAVEAAATSGYNITVRFWGQAMTDAQKAMFLTAAARISGMVVGGVPDADARGSNIDLKTTCNVDGQPILNEVIHHILIFASIQPIDGPGGILARSGPCIVRQDGNRLPAIGIMEFDSADIQTLSGAGSFQEVIIHEMLHSLGYGTVWNDDVATPKRALLINAGTADPRFTGAQAGQACRALGANITCAQSVPVEGTPAPKGTADSHWRKSTFKTELMTGYIDPSPNPISSITAGSMGDLGYSINMADTDFYRLPATTTLRASSVRASGSPLLSSPTHEGWEQMLPIRALLTPDGRLIPVRQ